jgi:hypothetical protein
MFLGILAHTPDSRDCLFNEANTVQEVGYERVTAQAAVRGQV